MKQTPSSQNITATKKVGSVNYATGVVKIERLLPEAFITGTEIRIKTTPVQTDIFPQRNTILFIEDATLTVTTYLS